MFLTIFIGNRMLFDLPEIESHDSRYRPGYVANESGKRDTLTLYFKNGVSMALHLCLDDSSVLPDDYRVILKSTDAPQRLLLLLQRFDLACGVDPHMQPGATPRQMYYKGFAQALRPILIDQLDSAINNGKCPELHITLADGKTATEALGYSTFGSPQDFLYGFTSERYPNWSSALAEMGFKSAVMVGEQHAVVTMAPRELNFENPTTVIDELSGAIATDFWETGAMTGSIPTLKELLDEIYESNMLGSYPYPSSTTSISADLESISAQLANIPYSRGYDFQLAMMAREVIVGIQAEPTNTKQYNSYKRLLSKLRPSRPSESQEQIALKYVEEGNLLQKLLGGLRVDHIQSNVKNQKNPIRGSGCEVDSIYRVLGQKAVVLVEAKAGDTISRSQLYQMYETYRLKLPKDWEVIVVGVLLSGQKPGMPSTVKTVIDMVDVAFDDNALGRVTESLINMSIRKHYRWLIHQ